MIRVHEDSLDTYLKEIRDYPLIDREEEIELMRRIRRRDDEALHRLIRSNLRFVISIAIRFQNQGLSLADLICEGNVGLMKAADKFDETRGVRFISYAVYWIRHSIMDAISCHTNALRIPLSRSRTLTRLKKEVSYMEQALGRSPTETEVADVMNIEMSELKKLEEISKPARRLEAPLFEGSDEYLEEFIPGETAGQEEQLRERELSDLTVYILSRLTDRQARILELYYGLNGNPPMTLERIGNIFDITRERVRQIRERALELLRDQSLRSDCY